MVANRPLATPAVLAIPISRLLLRGLRGLAGRMQRRVLWTHGDDWDPTGSSGHADTMARCAHHRRDTGTRPHEKKPVWIIAVAAVLGLTPCSVM